MNQILYSGGKKEKNNITKIVKAFCIIIIVFSLFFIVQGTYALVTKDSKTKIGAKSDSTPNVNVTSQGGKAILDISHSKGISKVEYSWNDGEKTSIDENNKTQIKEELVVPNGDCVLNITIVDSDGIETKCENWRRNCNKARRKSSIRWYSDRGKIIIRYKSVNRRIYAKRCKNW